MNSKLGDMSWFYMSERRALWRDCTTVFLEIKVLWEPDAIDNVCMSPELCGCPREVS